MPTTTVPAGDTVTDPDDYGFLPRRRLTTVPPEQITLVSMWENEDGWLTVRHDVALLALAAARARFLACPCVEHGDRITAAEVTIAAAVADLGGIADDGR